MKRYRSLLLVIVSVVELSWLAPWLLILGQVVTGREHVLEPLPVLSIFFLALAVAELLSRWRIASRYQQIVIGICILLSALLLIRGRVYSGWSLFNLRWIGHSLSNLLDFEPGWSRELFILLATFLLWWRGIRTSGRMLTVDEIGFQFRLGILFIIGLFVVQAFSGRQDAFGWMVSLFLSGLVAVALARVQDGLPAGQENRPWGLSWLLFLFVGAGGTLFLGMTFGMFLTTETMVSRWLQPLFHGIKTVLLYLLFGVSYVLIYVLNALIQAFFRAFPPGELAELETLTLSPPAMFEVTDLDSLAGPPAWLDSMGQVLLVMAIAGVFGLILISVRRWRLSLSDSPDVWRESVWSSRDVGQGLLKGLQNNLRRLAGLWSGREAQRSYSAATIRKIYASLLELAERRGAPRPPAETPFEYIPELRKTFPGWGAELQILTRAYVDAHYGRVPDTEIELQVLRDSWQRIRAWAENNPESEMVG